MFRLRDMLHTSLSLYWLLPPYVHSFCLLSLSHLPLFSARSIAKYLPPVLFVDVWLAAGSGGDGGVLLRLPLNFSGCDPMVR